ncbi:C2H2-type domain-containing protein [Mycena chlorophos]|uniref:C2H2-type domain-containing protein n=1 Tax=Mycena chlorophos TaxID=658473 RepID=A0A8H6S191_MYCCL|nr:C2H2-type domain-containing protein [Mycena chlorophos]
MPRCPECPNSTLVEVKNSKLKCPTCSQVWRFKVRFQSDFARCFVDFSSKNPQSDASSAAPALKRKRDTDSDAPEPSSKRWKGKQKEGNPDPAIEQPAVPNPPKRIASHSLPAASQQAKSASQSVPENERQTRVPDSRAQERTTPSSLRMEGPCNNCKADLRSGFVWTAGRGSAKLCRECGLFFHKHKKYRPTPHCASCNAKSSRAWWDVGLGPQRIYCNSCKEHLLSLAPEHVEVVTPTTESLGPDCETCGATETRLWWGYLDKPERYCETCAGWRVKHSSFSKGILACEPNMDERPLHSRPGALLSPEKANNTNTRPRPASPVKRPTEGVPSDKIATEPTALARSLSLGEWSPHKSTPKAGSISNGNSRSLGRKQLALGLLPVTVWYLDSRKFDSAHYLTWDETGRLNLRSGEGPSPHEREVMGMDIGSQAKVAKFALPEEKRQDRVLILELHERPKPAKASENSKKSTPGPRQMAFKFGHHEPETYSAFVDWLRKNVASTNREILRGSVVKAAWDVVRQSAELTKRDLSRQTESARPKPSPATQPQPKPSLNKSTVGPSTSGKPRARSPEPAHSLSKSPSKSSLRKQLIAGRLLPDAQQSSQDLFARPADLKSPTSARSRTLEVESHLSEDSSNDLTPTTSPSAPNSPLVTPTRQDSSSAAAGVVVSPLAAKASTATSSKSFSTPSLSSSSWVTTRSAAERPPLPSRATLRLTAMVPKPTADKPRPSESNVPSSSKPKPPHTKETTSIIRRMRPRESPKGLRRTPSLTVPIPVQAPPESSAGPKAAVSEAPLENKTSARERFECEVHGCGVYFGQKSGLVFHRLVLGH